MSEKPHDVYRKKSHQTKPVTNGIIGGILLLSVYFAILTIANSFAHAIEQFAYMWHWLVLLVVGFSIQIGLYTHIREESRLRSETGISSSSLAAAGGISTTSMIACCVHHITDLVPLLGLSAAALLLAEYQTPFIILGILSNLIGINIMLKIIQEHNLYQKDGKLLSAIMRLPMKNALYATTAFSVTVFLIALYTSLW